MDACSLALAVALAAPAAPSAAPPLPTGAPWWQEAVFYEIYPRSFQDSNGDGIGDLNGITSRLDYLAGLGVDALWITPFYPSPQVDFGYDVADFEAVDPQFGTLADFDRLVAEAKKRGIRIVTDMVLNHTSDQHRFFQDARSSRESPHRNFYVWRDGTPDHPPNNWYSGFGPNAWTFDEKTGQYYYHFFYVEQPDLNWRNPTVEKAMFDACRFWLARGVAGFRLDAVNWLFEDPALRDNPVLPRPRMESAEESEQELKYNRDLPETHDVLRRLRKVTDEYPGDRILIGEIWVPTMDQLVAYYGGGDEVQLPFNFFFTKVEKLGAAAFRGEVDKAEAALHGRPTTYVLSNHDLVRAYDRYASGTDGDAVAKLLAAMLLTLRGSPFLYYGEEIGMVTTDPARIEEVRDPVGKRYWPRYKGRDGVRTPMQWDSRPSAGFTTGMPWLPVPPSAASRNVALESRRPDSVLAFYKRATRVRRGSVALRRGAYKAVGDDPDVFAYVRRAPGQTVLVALNMSGLEKPIPASPDVPAGSLRVLLSSNRARTASVRGAGLRLAPWEAVVLELPRR